MHNTIYYRAIKLKSQDKTFGFTDYLEDFIIDNTLYNSSATIRIDNITLNTTLNNTYTTFIIDANHDIKDILFNNEDLVVEIFYVKVINNSINLIKLKTCKVFQVRVENNKFIIEIIGIINQLNNNINLKYTNNCKACFGDHKCQINKESYIIKNVKVINVTKDSIDIDMTNAVLSTKIINLNKIDLKKIIENGYIIYNNKQYAKITKYNDLKIKICNIVQNTELIPGSYVNLQCQCDKSFLQCHTIFGNQMEFRGEILL
jgi:uncharacterized phage protein (TIGR02218 family)